MSDVLDALEITLLAAVLSLIVCAPAFSSDVSGHMLDCGIPWSPWVRENCAAKRVVDAAKPAKPAEARKKETKE